MDKNEYPEEFINDLWTSMPISERIRILELASIDVEKSFAEWQEEFNAKERDMQEALGGNWGREDEAVDLNEENNE